MHLFARRRVNLPELLWPDIRLGDGRIQTKQLYYIRINNKDDLMQRLGGSVPNRTIQTIRRRTRTEKSLKRDNSPLYRSMFTNEEVQLVSASFFRSLF